jgi:hypothetical protein
MKPAILYAALGACGSMNALARHFGITRDKLTQLLRGETTVSAPICTEAIRIVAKHDKSIAELRDRGEALFRAAESGVAPPRQKDAKRTPTRRLGP